MTDQEHAALSAQLARALGWMVAERVEHEGHVIVWGGSYPTRVFDYRDPTVYGPLIEWLGVEHQRRPWYSRTDSRWRMGGDLNGYDTLPEAVARAVIAIRGPR